jgi:hypothetical protein
MPKISKKIHWVWAGGEKKMPLKQAYDWLNENPDITGCLWVDCDPNDPELKASKELVDYYKKEFDSLGGTGFFAKRMEVKSIEADLLKPLEKDPAISKYIDKIRAMIRYEIGRIRPNFAVGSDIIRLLTTWKNGGIYFDLDIFSKKNSKKLSEVIDFNDTKENIYLATNTQRERTGRETIFDMEEILNDAYAVTEKHSLILNMIKLSIDHYYTLKEQHSDGYCSYKANLNYYNIIRAYTHDFAGNKHVAYSKDNGMRHATSYAGPGVWCEALSNYLYGFVSSSLPDVALVEGKNHFLSLRSENQTVIPLLNPCIDNKRSAYKEKNNISAWLLENIHKFNSFEDAFKATKMTIKFEYENLKMLRIDSYISDLKVAIGEQKFNANSKEYISQILDFIQQELDKYPPSLAEKMAVQLTFAYPESVEFCKKNHLLQYTGLLPIFAQGQVITKPILKVFRQNLEQPFGNDCTWIKKFNDGCQMLEYSNEEKIAYIQRGLKFINFAINYLDENNSRDYKEVDIEALINYIGDLLDVFNTYITFIKSHPLDELLVADLLATIKKLSDRYNKLLGLMLATYLDNAYDIEFKRNLINNLQPIGVLPVNNLGEFIGFTPILTSKFLPGILQRISNPQKLWEFVSCLKEKALETLVKDSFFAIIAAFLQPQNRKGQIKFLEKIANYYPKCFEQIFTEIHDPKQQLDFIKLLPENQLLKLTENKRICYKIITTYFTQPNREEAIEEIIRKILSNKPEDLPNVFEKIATPKQQLKFAHLLTEQQLEIISENLSVFAQIICACLQEQNWTQHITLINNLLLYRPDYITTKDVVYNWTNLPITTISNQLQFIQFLTQDEQRKKQIADTQIIFCLVEQLLNAALNNRKRIVDLYEVKKLDISADDLYEVKKLDISAEINNFLDLLFNLLNPKLEHHQIKQYLTSENLAILLSKKHQSLTTVVSQLLDEERQFELFKSFISCDFTFCLSLEDKKNCLEYIESIFINSPLAINRKIELVKYAAQKTKFIFSQSCLINLFEQYEGNEQITFIKSLTDQQIKTLITSRADVMQLAVIMLQKKTFSQLKEILQYIKKIFSTASKDGNNPTNTIELLIHILGLVKNQEILASGRYDMKLDSLLRCIFDEACNDTKFCQDTSYILYRIFNKPIACNVLNNNNFDDILKIYKNQNKEAFLSLDHVLPMLDNADLLTQENFDRVTKYCRERPKEFPTFCTQLEELNHKKLLSQKEFDELIKSVFQSITGFFTSRNDKNPDNINNTRKQKPDEKNEFK